MLKEIPAMTLYEPIFEQVEDELEERVRCDGWSRG